MQELSGEHLGYLHPRRVKNIKHDFNKMPSEIHENVPDSDSDSEEDETKVVYKMRSQLIHFMTISRINHVNVFKSIGHFKSTIPHF